MCVCVWWGIPRKPLNHEINMAPPKVFDRLRLGSLKSNDDLSSRRFVKSWYNVGFILIWLTWLKGQSNIFISVESCLLLFFLTQILLFVFFVWDSSKCGCVYCACFFTTSIFVALEDVSKEETNSNPYVDSEEMSPKCWDISITLPLLIYVMASKQKENIDRVKVIPACGWFWQKRSRLI